jgi:hypothetical protein
MQKPWVFIFGPSDESDSGLLQLRQFLCHFFDGLPAYLPAVLRIWAEKPVKIILSELEGLRCASQMGYQRQTDLGLESENAVQCAKA